MSAAAAAGALAARTVWLADPTDVGDETDKAGPIAIVVIVALCIACFLLFASMSRHLRKVRERYAEEQADPEPRDASATNPTGDDGAAPTGTAARPAGVAKPKSSTPPRP